MTMLGAISLEGLNPPGMRRSSSHPDCSNRAFSWFNFAEFKADLRSKCSICLAINHQLMVLSNALYARIESSTRTEKATVGAVAF